MIAVVGSVNIDLVASVRQLPRRGETVPATDFTTVDGGKGANQAVAAARLGGDVALIASVGDDSESGRLRAALVAEGVAVDALQTEAGSTSGIALITVDSTGENTIAVHPGANGLLSLTVDSRALLERADIVLMQLEVPIETVIDAATIASGTVIVNAAPAVELPPSLIDQIDVLIVNEHERSVVLEGRVESSVPIVITTLGAEGASVTMGRETVLVAAPVVDVVDTTGAGDTFCGAFAEALDRGEDVLDAVRWATCAGALATTRVGARTAMPTRSDMQREVRKPQ
ncbi:MAG: ribokinase [Acidimicrobiia bacterium]|nr:MAG: ribokinase [Acidimicrobiia bacterium]